LLLRPHPLCRFWISDACNVTSAKDDLICVHSLGTGDTETCTLTHTVPKAEQAVEDPEMCHQTWLNLFLLYGLLRIGGGLFFFVASANYVGLTASIDQKSAQMHGAPDMGPANGGGRPLSGTAGESHANGQEGGGAGLAEANAATI
jgi:hypothetical protein